MPAINRENYTEKPHVCPHCGADLNLPNSIWAWQTSWHDRKWHGTVRSDILTSLKARWNHHTWRTYMAHCAACDTKLGYM